MQHIGLPLALLVGGTGDAVGKMSERARPFTLSAVACKFGLRCSAFELIAYCDRIPRF